MFFPAESRNIEDDILANADSNIVESYFAFNEALKNKQFFAPENTCADYYYEILSREPQLERLHSSMRRNYAAALQDDAQQVMNIMLKSGLTEEVLKNAKAEDIYKDYPRYLERAGELLGTEHYMYDATNIRLAELTLGYNFQIKSKTISQLSLSFVGRNLFFFMNKAPFDPEISMSTGTAMQGVEVFALPATRSFGLNLILSLN